MNCESTNRVYVEKTEFIELRWYDDRLQLIFIPIQCFSSALFTRIFVNWYKEKILFLFDGPHAFTQWIPFLVLMSTKLTSKNGVLQVNVCFTPGRVELDASSSLSIFVSNNFYCFCDLIRVVDFIFINNNSVTQIHF